MRIIAEERITIAYPLLSVFGAVININQLYLMRRGSFLDVNYIIQQMGLLHICPRYYTLCRDNLQIVLETA